MLKASVQNVAGSTPEAKPGLVQDVIGKSIEKRKLADKRLIKRTMRTIKGIQKKDSLGLSDTEKKSGTTSRLNSGNSGRRRKGSKPRWKQPRTVRQFASQVNAVATKVLNGEIDMDEARVYASLTRVLAQAASIEVTRSRFLKQIPDLTIDDLMIEGDEQ